MKLWKGINFSQCLVCTKYFEWFFDFLFKKHPFYCFLSQEWKNHLLCFLDVTVLHTFFSVILNTSKSNSSLKHTNLIFFLSQSLLCVPLKKILVYISIIPCLGYCNNDLIDLHTCIVGATIVLHDTVMVPFYFLFFAFIVYLLGGGERNKRMSPIPAAYHIICSKIKACVIKPYIFQITITCLGLSGTNPFFVYFSLLSSF